MALMITEDCINCQVCEPECPKSVLPQEFVAFLSFLRRFGARRADEGVVGPRRGGATQHRAGAGAPCGRAGRADGAASPNLDGQVARLRPGSLRRPPSRFADMQRIPEAGH
jgi:ferredoxin